MSKSSLIPQTPIRRYVSAWRVEKQPHSPDADTPTRRYVSAAGHSINPQDSCEAKIDLWNFKIPQTNQTARARRRKGRRQKEKGRSFSVGPPTHLLHSAFCLLTSAFKQRQSDRRRRVDFKPASVHRWISAGLIWQRADSRASTRPPTVTSERY